VIGCMPAGENNGSMIQDVDAVLTEISSSNAFNMYEWPEINF
jgi:hypothetical protein